MALDEADRGPCSGRARDLIAKLEARARHIAFFGAGHAMAANMAIAQFTGWNIPGVGEPGQRRRPRTRIYATDDPDTLRQVCETIDYANTAFVFVSDAAHGATVHVQARAMLPSIRAALGSEAPAHVAGVVSGEPAAADPELQSLIRAFGGEVLSVSGAAGALSVHGQLVGIARGLDDVRVRAGARAVCERVTAGPVVDDGLGLPRAWLNPSGGGGSNRPPTRVIVAARDRLGMFAGWAAQTWNTARASSKASRRGGAATAPLIRDCGVADVAASAATGVPQVLDVFDVAADDRTPQTLSSESDLPHRFTLL
ncbi:MAG: hypothetical protein AAGJ53_02485, partial [Pseudomonadota bacterium]